MFRYKIIGLLIGIFCLLPHESALAVVSPRSANGVSTQEQSGVSIGHKEVKLKKSFKQQIKDNIVAFAKPKKKNPFWLLFIPLILGIYYFLSGTAAIISLLILLVVGIFVTIKTTPPTERRQMRPTDEQLAKRYRIVKILVIALVVFILLQLLGGLLLVWLFIGF